VTETRYSLDEINAMTRDEFVSVLGPIFEHSPWIAEAAWSRQPFSSVEDLYQKLCDVVTHAYVELQMALIRAHPDLVGRAALEGTLTASSAREQAAAGLNQLTPDEIALFKSQNAAYQARYGFPFVICARTNKKDAILNGFRIRLHHTREVEIRIGLEEIKKIAWFRLLDLMEPSLAASAVAFHASQSLNP
jgi:OHCU decarboxylase